MSNLEKLYYNIDKLTDNCADTPEKLEAENRLEEAIGHELYIKHEDEICLCMAASEKQGFIQGFPYAVSLLIKGGEV